jgi:hypothetical protein
MVLALINTVFAQDSQDAAIAQWRVVADQVPKKFPKLAVLIYDPESNVRSGGPNGIGDHHAGYELIGASQRGDQIAARVGGRRCYDSDVFRRIDCAAICAAGWIHMGRPFDAAVRRST